MEPERAADVRFDLRLAAKTGAAAHRTFKGTFHAADSAFTICEVKQLAQRAVVNVISPRAPAPRPTAADAAAAAAGGEEQRAFYRRADVAVGARLEIGGTTYVVTAVEGDPRGTQLSGTQPIADTKRVAHDDRRLLALQEKMRAKIRERGAKTIRRLGKHFKIIDDNSDGGIDAPELSKALREYGFDVADDEVRLLIEWFDRDGNGRLDYEEFLRLVRGEMSEFRRGLVRKAFQKLDANKNGCIDPDDIRKFYSAKANPHVRSGKFTEEEVVKKVLANFASGRLSSDGRVSYEQFEDYYSGVSVSIDDDDYFAIMMHQAWNID